MASVCSPRCMIIRFTSDSFEHLIEHGRLHDQSIESLALHDAARAVENLIRDRSVAPHGKTMHEPTLGCRFRKPVVPDAPVQKLCTQSGVTGNVAIAAGATPFLGINNVCSLERIL